MFINFFATLASMNRIKLFAIIFFVLLSVRLDAQCILKVVSDNFPETQVPYPVDSLKNVKNLGNSRYSNVVQTILQSLKVYEDLNLSQSTGFSTDDDYNDIFVSGKFSIPNTSFKMILVEVMKVEFVSSGLFLTNEDGDIVDYLECESSFAKISSRQFYVDNNYDITVYALIPDLDDITFMSMYCEGKSFTAHREDKKYRVVNGRFTLIESKVYRPKVYYSSEFLNKPSYHLRYRICEGNEVL